MATVMEAKKNSRGKPVPCENCKKKIVAGEKYTYAKVGDNKWLYAHADHPLEQEKVDEIVKAARA